jgi:hypothetical protein
MENHTSMDGLIPASNGEQRKVSPPNLTNRAAQTRKQTQKIAPKVKIQGPNKALV